MHWHPDRGLSIVHDQAAEEEAMHGAPLDSSRGWVNVGHDEAQCDGALKSHDNLCLFWNWSDMDKSRTLK